MSTDNHDPYGKFLTVYLQELVETPDADILKSEKDIPSDFGAKLLASCKALPNSSALQELRDSQDRGGEP
jgi:hypothetical protein